MTSADTRAYRDALLQVLDDAVFMLTTKQVVAQLPPGLARHRYDYTVAYAQLRTLEGQGKIAREHPTPSATVWRTIEAPAETPPASPPDLELLPEVGDYVRYETASHSLVWGYVLYADLEQSFLEVVPAHIQPMPTSLRFHVQRNQVLDVVRPGLNIEHTMRVLDEVGSVVRAQ